MPQRFPDGSPSVIPATVTQIIRSLPSSGEIMVRLGSRVEPDDLIGQCTVQGDPLLIDVAGALGIEPRDLRRRLRRKAGDRVAFRDVIARKRGRSVLAPFTGVLSAADDVTGFVVLTPDPVPASVTASVRGYVVDLQPNRSATIETAAAVVQGAVGFGGEQWGVLRALVAGPAQMITPDLIDARSAFSIVIGGSGITAEALRKAQAEQVKGIIVGGIDARELESFWGQRFDGRWSYLLRGRAALRGTEEGPSLLVTEGFGTHAMSRPIFDLLTRFDRQEALLDGTTRLDMPERRPRLVIPLAGLPGGAPPPAPTREVRPGAIVRLMDERYLGRIGRVERVQPQGRLPSGIRATVALVQVDESERIALPESALDVIE